MTPPKTPRKRTPTKRVTPAKKRAPTKRASVKAPGRMRKAKSASVQAPQPPLEPDPTHGHNRQAAEATIAALRKDGRLETVDSARIATLQALADAVDLDPSNASLWREYRAAEAVLREVNDDDTDGLEDLLRRVSSSVGDEKDEESKDARSRGRRRS